MSKRTLFFVNPCYLSLKHGQLLVRFPKDLPSQMVPMEDMACLLLENSAITTTIRLLESCVTHGVAVIICDPKHLPVAMLQPFTGHSTHGETMKAQIGATESLCNRLWKRTIIAKITNQAQHLKQLGRKEASKLERLANKVMVGDKDNREAVAAKIYWQSLFPAQDFTRERYGFPPNNLLNYGYAILRAAVARALTASGLYPAIGIAHHNRYNAFCLADDIMEPYRPFVDTLVYELYTNGEQELTTAVKSKLLSVLVEDTYFVDSGSPLMTGLTRTTSSLRKSFIAKKENLLFPDLLP